MLITETKLSIANLVKGYRDDGDGGVFAYGGKLAVRPAYQREFVYKEAQRNAVIASVRNGYPINVMYWAKTGDNTYEVLDGQQRTISICQYCNKEFPIRIDGNDKFFHNLTDTERKQLEKYQLTIYICDGTEEEKLAWFRAINIAGEVLNTQELLNAAYTGPWLSDAKQFFSKRNCVAGKMADGYLKGNPIRQEYLERVLGWIAHRDGLKDGQAYMAIHQHDKDANDLWLYFQSVINWAKMLFPNKRKGITDSQEWGIIYNKYHNNGYNTNDLEADIKRLMLDDDVTCKKGIVAYVLSDRTPYEEKHLSIRAFSEAQKLRAYEAQEHKCPLCQQQGIDTEYDFSEMEGDHIIPWSQGGRTIDSNLQMLCRKCNNNKSNK